MLYPWKGKLEKITDILNDKYLNKYTIEYDVLNAENYGICQSRPRAIVKMYKHALDHIQTNTTFVAQYAKTDRIYNLTFKNWDGTILSKQTATWGSSVVYSGPTPTREKDEAGTYVFNGWSPYFDYVHSDKEYVAQYQHKLNVYTLTYLNWDGSFLATQQVEWGGSGTLWGDFKRASTKEHTYTFAGWDKPLGPIKQNTTFTAVYREDVRQYDVKFVNSDGTVLQTSKVSYNAKAAYNGATPSRSSDDFIYTFKAWDKDPALTPIDGDTTFTATYDAKTNYAVFKFIMLLLMKKMSLLM